MNQEVQKKQIDLAINTARLEAMQLSTQLDNILLFLHKAHVEGTETDAVKELLTKMNLIPGDTEEK